MKTGKKISGGKYMKGRKKKLREYSGKPRFVILGELKKKSLRISGGRYKTVLLATNKANLYDKKGKCKIVKINNVLETPANTFLARTNRLIKGAIIATEAGKAKITNRPSQEGQVNAILI